MEKSTQPVKIAFTRTELWNLLKMFRDGEHVYISVALEQKLILAYHDQLSLQEKANDANKHLLQNYDKDINDITDIPDNMIDAVWVIYLDMIKQSKEIKHYEPISYIQFAKILDKFLENYTFLEKIHVSLPIEVMQNQLEDLKEMLAEEEAHSVESADFVGENKHLRSTAKTISRVAALQTAVQICESLMEDTVINAQSTGT